MSEYGYVHCVAWVRNYIWIHLNSVTKHVALKIICCNTKCISVSSYIHYQVT